MAKNEDHFDDDFDEAYHDDLPSDQERFEKKQAKYSLGFFGALLSVGIYLFFNGTFAANINLNNGGRTEFGQGILIATSCSGNNSITVTPQASFTNAGGGGTWYFSGVRISGIPTSCYGFQFTLKSYDTSTSTALSLFGNNQTEVEFYDNSGTFIALTGSNGLTLATISTTSLTATFDTPIASSSNTIKLTLESAPYNAITTSDCSSYLASTSNTTISVSGGTCIISFTSSTNTFTAPAGVKSISVLVVAGGGGGGGGAFGGGGGAGGLIYNATYSTTPGSNYSITVGAGGNGGNNSLGTSANYTDNSGVNGSNSIFGTLTAIGGGGGGGYTTTYKDYHSVAAGGSIAAFTATKLAATVAIDSSKGKDGGSGGGSSENTYWRGAATSGQGNIGGTPLLTGFTLNLESAGGAGNTNQSRIASGGGGGGAGSVGLDVSTDYIAGNGGAGLQNSITGANVWYAAGGGGGVGTPVSGTPTKGTGGSSIGGNGGSGGPNGCGTVTTPSAGSANTGSGGGGAGYCSAVQSGGNGGSGIVIIRFNP